jgi:hypothetical protein
MASLSNVKTLYIGGNPYTSPLLHGAIRPCIGSLTMKVVVGECMPNVNNKGKAGEKGSKHEPNALIEGMLYHTPAKAREAIVEETQRTTTKHATVEPVWRENLVFKLLDYSDSVTINLRHGMDMMPTDEQREAGEPVLGTLRVQTLATILIQDIFWSCHNLDSVGKMAEHAKAMYAKKDEIITAEGDRDGTYFFVLSGEVEMRQAGGESRKSVPVGKLELLHVSSRNPCAQPDVPVKNSISRCCIALNSRPLMQNCSCSHIDMAAGLALSFNGNRAAFPARADND